MDHDGFSFIECLSECVEFYEGAFDSSNPRKGGTFNLATLDGFSSAGSPRGLEVAGDGTIYLTATLAPTTSDGTIYKIALDLSSASSASVSGAMDLALFGGKAYVTQYLHPGRCRDHHDPRVHPFQHLDR